MTSRRVYVLFATAAVALSGFSGVAARASTATAGSAAARLRRDAVGLQIFNHSDGRPSFVVGKIAVSKFSKSGTAGGRAHDFWKTYGGVFGLADPDTQLHQVSSRTDSLGMTSLKFQQRYHGLDVVGRQLVLHLRGNAVTSANGDFLPSINVPTRASISSSDAAGRANARYAREGGTSVGNEKLVIFIDGGGRAHLAWKVITSTARPFGIWVSYIDARTGQLAGTRDGLHAAEVRNVYDNGMDPDCYSNPPVTDDNQCNLPGTPARLDGAGAVADSDVNSAYDKSGTVWNFYNTTFGRDSFDNAGGAINSTVHFGDQMANAFWCNTDCVSVFTTHAGEQMIYGDGDGVSFSSFAQDPDIVAHELTHGVTGHTAAFDYIGQSGALDESYADTFAYFISGGDPVLGETSCTACGVHGLRDLSSPADDYQSVDPSNMSGFVTTFTDSGGVHTNSLIPSHAAYLLASGTTGLLKAEQIYYRALTTYLTSTADFTYNALALYLSASDLFGPTSDELKAVVATQRAVGISISPSIVAPGTGSVLKGGALTSVDWSGVGTEGSQYSVDYSTTSSSTTYSQTFEGTTIPSNFGHLATDNGEWVSTSSDKYSGSRSVRAYPISDNQSSSLTLKRTLTGVGTVSFAYRVSSEYGFDFFSFFIDGNVVLADTGYASGRTWETVSILVGQGTHTFTWLYEKDSEDVPPIGADTAYIDNLSITQSPTVTWHPVDVGTAIDAHTTDWTPPTTSGTTYRVRVHVLGIPEEIGESISDPFTVDATKPSASITSSLSLWQLGLTTASGGTAKYSIPLSISDPLSGIDTYDVTWKYLYPTDTSYTTGSPNPLIQGQTGTFPTTFTSSFPGSFTGAEGSTTCFAARAKDGVGNQGSYGSYRCTAAPISALHLAPHGSWSGVGASGYYMSFYGQSYTQGAYQLSGSWRAKRVAIVATKCSSCGVVEVYRGSTLLARVSLYSSSTHKRQLINIKTFSSVQPAAKFKIRVYSSGKLVRIEGLGLSAY